MTKAEGGLHSTCCCRHLQPFCLLQAVIYSAAGQVCISVHTAAASPRDMFKLLTGSNDLLLFVRQGISCCRHSSSYMPSARCSQHCSASPITAAMQVQRQRDRNPSKPMHTTPLHLVGAVLQTISFSKACKLPQSSLCELSCRPIIQHLRNIGPGNLYATSMSPPAAQQIISALRLILGEDGTGRGLQKIQQLHDNSNWFRKRLKQIGCTVLGDNDSPVMVRGQEGLLRLACCSRVALLLYHGWQLKQAPHFRAACMRQPPPHVDLLWSPRGAFRCLHCLCALQPIMLYNPGKISAVSRLLFDYGIAMVVVGFPATPLLTSRMRVCISAAHTREDLEWAAQVSSSTWSWTAPARERPQELGPAAAMHSLDVPGAMHDQQQIAYPEVCQGLEPPAPNIMVAMPYFRCLTMSASAASSNTIPQTR